MSQNSVEIVHKEIDLIQNCIARMAQNSFLIKGWAISIVAVVLALTEKNLDPIYLSLVVVIPLGAFWYLDAFFLQTERKYRKMYEWMIAQRNKNDFSFQYDLNPKRFESEVDPIWKVMQSLTLSVFYGIPLMVVIVIMEYQVFKGFMPR